MSVMVFSPVAAGSTSRTIEKGRGVRESHIAHSLGEHELSRAQPAPHYPSPTPSTSNPTCIPPITPVVTPLTSIASPE